MKKYLILILVSAFGFVGFGFAADCTTLQNEVALRQAAYNTCKSECIQNNMLNPGSPEDCNDECSDELDTLNNFKNQLATCQSNNQGGTGGNNTSNNNTGNTGGSLGTLGSLGGGSQDCITLLAEIQGFGSMGPYTLEQQDKIDLSTQLKCSCGNKRYQEGLERKCCDGIIDAGKCITNNEGKMGIEMNSGCLINGQCKFDIYETLGIRKSLPRATRSSPGIFIQDIILSATFFVGTLITGVLIISGLLFVFSSARPELAAKAKKGVIGSLIGLLFVVGSYAFVRLIQFLITGGGG